MKRNIFAVDTTLNKYNTIPDGQVFVTKELKEDDLPPINDKTTIEKKPTMTKATAIEFGILFIGLIFAYLFMKSQQADDLSFADAIVAHPYYFIAVIVSFIAVIIFAVYQEKKVRKEATNKEETAEPNQETKEQIEIRKQATELKIPSDALQTSVLSFQYKEKNDSIKIKRNLIPFKFFSQEMNVYLKDDCLCFSNLFSVYSIPISSIQKIEKINKKASVFMIGTGTAINQDEIQNSLHKKDVAIITIQGYFTVDIIYMEKEYEIYIPDFAIEPILNLTGISVS